MVKTCPICSSSFEDKKHPDKKTCSRKCGSHYRIRKKLLDCTHCGKQFLGKAGVLFCSRECYDNHRTESRLLCDHCGSRLPPGRSSKHKHKFCSQSCKTAYFKPKPKPCINCGTIYTPIKFNKVQGKFYANSAMKTCSAKCHIEWIKNDPERKRKISIAFTGAKHPNWQGGKSTINIAVHRGSGWIRIAEKARIRDKHTCQICGKAEEENGRKLDVHHIKAYHDINDTKKANRMSNLISLCTVCHKTEEHKLKHQQIVFPFASIARDERHIALGRIFVTKTLYTKKPVSEESRAKRSASMLAMTRKHEIMLEWEGESKSLAQWARQYNLARDLVYKRIKEGGWPIGKALTHPHRKQLARKAAQ